MPELLKIRKHVLKKSFLSIPEICKRANEKGISYGMYVALYEVKSHESSRLFTTI